MSATFFMTACLGCLVVQTAGLMCIVLEIRRFCRAVEVSTTLSWADGEPGSTPTTKKLALSIGSAT